MSGHILQAQPSVLNALLSTMHLPAIGMWNADWNTDDVVARLATLDVSEMLTEALDVIKARPFTGGQICLQHRVGVEGAERFTDGVGTLVGRNLNDSDFSEFVTELTGGAIHTALSALPFRVARLRIAVVKPRTCYSIHRDQSMRIHVPLVTTPAAQMVFPCEQRVFHLPADGVFIVDTTRLHTAFNAAAEDRLHLMASVVA